MAELLNALITCNMKKVKLLMEKLKNVNFVVPNTGGLTALHVTAGTDSPNRNSIVDYLLEKGADPNARSHEGLTPVHIATMWGNSCVLKKLLNYGGNPWIHDSDVKNAFDMAMEDKSGKCLRLLDKYNYRGTLVRESIISESDSESIVANTCSDYVEETEFSDVTQDEDVTNGFGTQNYFSVLSEKYTSATDKFDHGKNVFGKRFSSRAENSKCNNGILKAVSWKVSNSCSSDQVSQAGKTLCPEVTLDSTFVKKFDDKFYSFRDNETQLCDDTHNRGFSHHTFVVDETLSTISNNTVRDFSEEYVITDEEDGIVLVEKCCPSHTSGDVFSDGDDSVDSGRSDWQLYQSARENVSHINSYLATHSDIHIPPELFSLNNSEIYHQLKKYGDNPGPVMNYTRYIYLQRLAKFKSGFLSLKSLPAPKYCHEIYMHLEGKMNVAKVKLMDEAVSKEYDDWAAFQNSKEGSQRSFFNYFLLDPRVTRNLPARAHSLTDEEKFHTFIDAVFYIGKGSRSRPFDHLYEAAKCIHSPEKANAKIRHILDIWQSGSGIISLHCFHNSISVEALTREACMIDAIGLQNLTNIKKGNYYGLSCRWSMSKKKQLGVFYLSRAMEIFLHEGERLIRPKDI